MLTTENSFDLPKENRNGDFTFPSIIKSTVVGIFSCACKQGAIIKRYKQKTYFIYQD